MLIALKALFFVSILISLTLAIPLTFAQNDISYVSPLKQIKNGILPQQVLCSKGFVRMEKLSDQSVLCVKSTTADVLSKRWWGILLTQEISKDQAEIKITEYAIKHHNCMNCLASSSNIEYVFLKHKGTKDVPNFLVYQSDYNSKSIGKEGQEISFIQSNETGLKWNQSEYYLNNTDNRYAWTSFAYVPIWTTMIFVDPLTGEVIGYYSAGCPACT